MVGSKWVASPFVLNYGVDTSGYVDNYMFYVDSSGEPINYFGREKSDVVEELKKYASPESYGVSFRCGDMSYIGRGVSTKEYNMVQLLFDTDGLMKICAVWLLNGESPKLSDYTMLGYVQFDKHDLLYRQKVRSPVLVSMDNAMFKYTSAMYADDLRIRFDRRFGKHEQYHGKVRMDAGPAESGRFERFSYLSSSFKLRDETVVSCINRIQSLKVSDFFVEE